MKKAGNQVWRRINGSVTSVLAFLTIASLTSLPWFGNNRYDPTAIPGSDRPQTASNAGVTSSPTPATSTLATPRLMPQKPATPLPVQSHIISNVFIPMAEKEGSPLSYQSRLPLLIKTGSTPLPSPLPELPFKGKTILVDLSDQHVYAYDKEKLVFSFVASTGRHNLTRAGKYKILDKIPNAYSDPWNFWMPYWMGIYYAGYNLENGFHSLPVLSNGEKLWGNKIGSPVTYGCVVLMPDDMKKLYRWAGIGTVVVIQK